MAFGYNTPYGQPYYQPPMMDNLAQMRAQQQPVQQGMIWVQGEAAGKSYLVAAGNTVPLWDSERQTIYLKSVDASGVPTMRIKNLDKIIMNDGYSRSGDWDASIHGNSYRRNRDNMGRYSRDDGYSRRDYSRASETERAIDQLEDMLKNAGGESEHMAIKKAINVLRNA